MSSISFLIAILSHTPIWVWAIFAFVAYMGYRRSRERVAGVWQLLIFPVIMIVVAGSGIAHAGLGITLPAILVGLAVGGTIGWLLEREGATRRLPNGRVWIRGEWWSFVQVLLIFGFRYGTTVAATVNPVLAADPIWQVATTLVSSLLSAMILGRTLARLRVYFTSPGAVEAGGA